MNLNMKLNEFVLILNVELIDAEWTYSLIVKFVKTILMQLK